jgi:hypothetical protein
MDDRFKLHMAKKYPNVDVERAIALVDKEVSEIRKSLAEEGDREIRLPLNSDLNKNIVIKIIDEYNKNQFSLGDKVNIDRYENEIFEVVGIRKDELELRGDWSAMNNIIGDSWYSTNKCKKA